MFCSLSKERLFFKTTLRRRPWWLSGKEFACPCRRCGFDPWSRKIPHAAEQLSPYAVTTETEPRAWELQVLDPVHPRALLPKRSHHHQKLSRQSLSVAPARHDQRKALVARKTQLSQKEINEKNIYLKKKPTLGVPWWSSSYESALSLRRPGFNPWLGTLRKILQAEQLSQTF